jgi:hypothetical protein
MDEASLRERLISAQGMDPIQRSSAPRGHDHRDDGLDPAGQSGNISPQDLLVLKEKFPQLAEFRQIPLVGSSPSHNLFQSKFLIIISHK